MQSRQSLVVVASCLLLAIFVRAGHGASGLVGGYTEPRELLSLSNDEQDTIVNAALKSLELINSASNGDSTNDLKLSKVISFSTQVVAGTNYKLILEVLRNGKPFECNAAVSHLYPWLGEQSTWSLLSAPKDSCLDLATETKQPLLGGKDSLDENEQVYAEKAANWAVEHINAMSNSLFRNSLQKILKVKKQVVNGYLYHMKLLMVPTSCRNNEKNKGKTLLECPASNDGHVQLCDVSVADVRGDYHMKDFKCNPAKNNMIGGGDHDYMPHEKRNIVIGGDDHDYKPHEKSNNLIGGDDHDFKPHEKIDNLIGGDDHDFKPHGKSEKLIGGDDHDFKPHDKIDNLIGGDDHDFKPHEKIDNWIGGDDHDYHPRGLMNKLGSSKDKEFVGAKRRGLVENMSILGGGDHDFVPHPKCVKYVDEFKAFKAKYNKVYTEQKDEAQRFQVFCENMHKVQIIQKHEKGSAVYGATQFADMTEEEFSKQYLGFKPSLQSEVLPAAEIPNGPIPDSWDWRDHGAVTEIKNQGSCGSCWAFSTTGNIEGQYFVRHKKLVSLSEQELVDCDKLDEGCNGGLPSNAYKSLMELGGIEPEKDYEYEGRNDKCSFDKTEVAVKLSGAVNISQNEDEMAAWLYHNGPISIGINAFAMQFYFGGIAHPWKIFCNPRSLDHGVLIVGYGKEGNEPYWIVKNSWGPGWGREGYYYVYRGDGTCGLNTMCTSATVV